MRRENDFYPTRPWVTTKLVRAMDKYVKPELGMDPLRSMPVLDPFAGDGAILRQLQKMGCRDLHAWELDSRHEPSLGDVPGLGTLEFVDTLVRTPALDTTVVTNPPYGDLAYKCVKHFVLDNPVAVAAFLLPVGWVQAKQRARFFQRHPPVFQFVVPGRIKFTEKGNAAFGCAWYVWLRDHTARATCQVVLPLGTRDNDRYPI